MTNKKQGKAKAAAAPQAAKATAATPEPTARTAVVVEGTPLVGAVTALTSEQEQARQAAREAEFNATENSLTQRVADSGFWWVEDNGAHEQYIGPRPEAMDDPRLAKVIQLNPLMTLRNFDGREVRLADGTRFTIQGDIQTADQIRLPNGEALIGSVDKAKSAERRKVAEAQWKADDEG